MLDGMWLLLDRHSILEPDQGRTSVKRSIPQRVLHALHLEMTSLSMRGVLWRGP